MFENITMATYLENEIRAKARQYDHLETVYKGHMHNRDAHNARQTGRRMVVLGEEIDRLRHDWEVETGKQWKLFRFNDPAPDEVMETAFARLADELEAQAAAELEKRETLLFHMLSHATHFLERFLKRQEARDTPQSLEVAEYIKGELETAQAWRDELKEAERGSHETANMGKAN